MEVKNKRIETEKRRMEVEASQQRETVKKAAFLQVRLLLLSIFAIIIFFSLQAFPNPISNPRHWQPSTKIPVTFCGVSLSIIMPFSLLNITAFDSSCMVEVFTIGV